MGSRDPVGSVPSLTDMFMEPLFVNPNEEVVSKYDKSKLNPLGMLHESLQDEHLHGNMREPVGRCHERVDSLRACQPNLRMCRANVTTCRHNERTRHPHLQTRKGKELSGQLTNFE